MAHAVYEFPCGTCNEKRQHRYNADKGYYVCTTCESTHTLGVDREAYERQKNREAREVLNRMYEATATSKGPWEGQTVCTSCHHEILGGMYASGEYYSNNSVCPYCGVWQAGLTVIIRRRVFLEPARKQPWWRDWLLLEEMERKFRWEVKEADD